MSLKLILPVLLLLAIFCFNASSAHESTSGSCPFSGHEPEPHNHHHHHGHHHHLEGHLERSTRSKLPEEFAEDEDLELYGFTDHGFDDDPPELSKISLWVNAMGCSLLVSMASLICLIILPVILYKGKPSKTVVDSLALFGAGAMLGDAFLHQLPHAFGGGHSHSHDHQEDHLHDHFHHLGREPSHSHSIEDLSIGLSVLSGIVLFLLVEKVVRYVEDHSAKGALAWGHGHHHHQHKSTNELKEDDLGGSSLSSHSNRLTDHSLNNGKHGQPEDLLRKRSTSTGAAAADELNSDAVKSSITDKIPLAEKEPASSASSLVFGYLNLFSDGVHNFTDGMALGSAFLLYGSVGGWSRTLFLLAHELPQEVGDFGILVRSGFSVPKALFFNFLSALVALAGTALALLLGKDPGQSSLIEGFTAGGFIYIAVAGVLPEMHRGRTTLTTTLTQLTALILGMAVAFCISLME